MAQREYATPAQEKLGKMNDKIGSPAKWRSYDFAVSATDLFPVLDAGEEHAGADDMLEGSSSLRKSRLNELEDGACLLGGGELFGSDRTGA